MCTAMRAVAVDTIGHCTSQAPTQHTPTLHTETLFSRLIASAPTAGALGWAAHPCVCERAAYGWVCTEGSLPRAFWGRDRSWWMRSGRCVQVALPVS